MQMEVGAEGVETREQHEFIRDVRYEAVQGYLFSEPLPLDKFRNLLGARRQAAGAPKGNGVVP